MIAYDTDVFTQLLLGSKNVVGRARLTPDEEQFVPIVVVEEIVRGRLLEIRNAEAGRGKVMIDRAYGLFEETIRDLRHCQILAFTIDAEKQFQQWRQQKIRVATHDLRIAATCVAHSATLISRNRRDFERVPDLTVEYWD